MRHATFMTWMFVATSCGVEVGNPHGDQKTGSVQLSLVNAPDLGESFQLSFASAQLSGYNDAVDLQSALNLTSETVELVSGDAGDTISFALSEQVQTGVYDSIVLTLRNEQPVRYVDSNAEEVTVAFEDDSEKIFYISESFELAEGETADLVVDLDVERSLGSKTDGRHIFKPKGGMHPRKRGLTHTGTITQDDGSVVCAYLYDAIHPTPPRPRPPIRGKRPPTKGKLDPKKSFATKDDLELDEDAQCANAYARTRVTDGTYTFHHLRPGSYQFRLFLEDGSYVDLDDEETTLEPPQPSALRRWPARR